MVPCCLPPSSRSNSSGKSDRHTSSNRSQLLQHGDIIFIGSTLFLYFIGYFTTESGAACQQTKGEFL
jgi:hypothetical protein